ncbi:MAG: hypothetical protein ACOX87_06625 [Chloroflexota bacterium]
MGKDVSSSWQKSPAIGDGWLVGLLVVLMLAVVVSYPLLFGEQGFGIRPGDTVGHLLGIAGGLLMAVGLAYPLVKRTHFFKPIRSWWHQWHLLLGLLGAFLALLHTAGRLGKAPTLVLLASLGLLALGAYGRLLAGRLIHANFAADFNVFLPNDATGNPQHLLLIKEKAKLVAFLEPEAREGTFSLTLRHWIRHPLASAAFAWLALQEERLMLERRKLPNSLVLLFQRYWRLLHLVLVALMGLGILAHAGMVIFFAGYIADGVEPYWWYIRK